jgi:hypothetical protein
VDWFGLVVDAIMRGRKPIFGGESIFKSGFVEEVIRREIDFQKVLDSPIVLWIGVMDYVLGRTEWISNKDIGMTPEKFEMYVYASMRIPVFFRHHGQKGDLGLNSNLAIDKAIELGFEKVLALNALPHTLEQISGVETWPESNMRSDDINHVAETQRHIKLTEWINGDVLAMRNLRKFWLVRIGCFFSRRFRNLLDCFYFANKRYIDLCVICPPSSLQIFKKWIVEKKVLRFVPLKNRVIYGHPSFSARQELLSAGREAIGKELVPFLERIGINIPKDV